MTRILSAFAALALVLASVGLYGLLGYAVTRRTNEIGIRLAPGATPGTVLWSVLRESCTLVAVGLAISVPATLAMRASRQAGSMIRRIAPTICAHRVRSAASCFLPAAVSR